MEFSDDRNFVIVAYGDSGTDVFSALCIDPLVCASALPVCKQTMIMLYYNDVLL